MRKTPSEQVPNEATQNALLRAGAGLRRAVAEYEAADIENGFEDVVEAADELAAEVRGFLDALAKPQ